MYGRGRGRGGGGRGGGDRGGSRGGGRGGGGQRWWDPEWRNAKLAEMREKGGRNQIELDREAMRRRMEDLVNDPHAEEIVVRENYGREGAAEIGAIARGLRLHFRQYGKGTNTALVASKVPLPDYRADLDGRRRAEHEVDMSPETMSIVARALRDSPSVEDLSANLGSLTHASPSKRQRGDRETTSRVETSHLLRRDASVDAAARTAELQRRASPHVAARRAQRARLPAFERRDELLAAVDASNALVVSGETGCGKTTQLPQFVLERALASGDASVTSILCTQPRRISAISVAARVAQERGEELGESVGYQIRLEARRSADTRLLFCTTGVLLRRLATEPTLASVSHVFVDEIHERGMNEDFLLVVLRDLLPRRPDLKVVLMSATLDAGLFARYFGGAPVAHIPGFTYPVRELFLEDALEAFGDALVVPPPEARGDGFGGGGTAGGGGFGRRRGRFGGGRRGRAADALGYNPDEDEDDAREAEDGDDDPSWASLSPRTRESLGNWRRRCAGDDGVDVDLVKNLVAGIVASPADPADPDGDGAILVFLTGWDEITKVNDLMRADRVLGDRTRCVVLPLHGAMPTANQREIFDRPPLGVRKIILSTNIAETSITIDDVTHVVDCGKSKEKTYDALNNLACLQPAWISKASAHQRRGRAGRVREGVCYRLYTRAQHAKMADHATPELLRTPLEELCLTIKSLGLGLCEPFIARALQPPEPKSVHNAIELLITIGALSRHTEELTPLGRHLAALPVDPRVGKMLVTAATFGCLSPALTIAAGMAYKDPFVLPMDKKHQADAVRRRLAGDTYSDHIALVRAFEGWERARRDGGNREGWEYCRRNFLSGNTLELMSDMRRQFADLLCGIGFLPDGARSADRVDASHNRHAADVAMLRAVICAGMYPRLVSVRARGRRNELKTHEDGKVECHPSSVNSEFGASFPFPWLVYCEKVKTSGVYIRDSTCVPAYAVLLLGGDLDEEPDDDGRVAESSGDDACAGDVGIRVCGGHYTFSAPRDVLALVRKLRREIDSLLDAKARNPGLDAVGGSSTRGGFGSGFVDAMRALVADEERAAYGGGGGGDRWGGDDRGGDRGGRGGRRGGRGGFGGGFGTSGGDWQCSNGCGLVFGGKRSCFRCGAPREGDRGGEGRGGLGGGPPAPRHVRF